MASYVEKRNQSVHLYDEDEIDELILLIKDTFLPAFARLGQTLEKKLEEIKEE